MARTIKEFTDDDKWQLDQLIIRWWDASDVKDKKRIELECYKEFKTLDFNPDLITYLRENDSDTLADEMEHFKDLYQKVPHEHEDRKAA